MFGKYILVGITGYVFMAKEIGKDNGKGFGKEKWNFWNFVYKNKGK